MSTYRSFRKKKLMSEINVVPYIDVMLVLLVIFMVTAPLLTQGVQVDLPQASAEAISEEVEPVVLTIKQDGELYIDQDLKQENEVHAYAAAVLRRNPEAKFLVRGDKRTEFQKVIEAMVLLQQAGVASVGVVTQSPDEG